MSFLIEVSYEIGNKVGGIWTVITSKAPYLIKKYGANYMGIGYYNPEKAEVIEMNLPEGYADAVRKFEDATGIKVHYGLWIPAKNLPVFLLDTREYMKKNVNVIKYLMWKHFGIDSLYAPPDYDDPVAWAYAAGMFISMLIPKLNDQPIVHVHEWLSVPAILYLKIAGLRVPTVFTTHATIFGRALTASQESLYNIEEQARRFGVWEKHQVERVGAHTADVFTTVSRATAIEAEKFLGKKPDVITWNGINARKGIDIDQLIRDKVQLREKIEDFARAYFLPYYRLSFRDVPVVYTAGRFEYLNKGYDLFIEALAELDRRLREEGYDRWVLAFILVPTGTIGIKDEVVENFLLYNRVKELLKEDAEDVAEKVLTVEDDKEIEKLLYPMVLDIKKINVKLRSRRGRNPPLTPFELWDKNNPIIKKLEEVGLINSKENKVKVVYYPVYLNRQDELLGLTFREFVTAASAGVFLSRYEPWGYTPVEAALNLSIAITTDRSGFGMEILNKGAATGVYVVPLEEAAFKSAEILSNFVHLTKEKRLEVEIKAHTYIKNNFDWELAIEEYLKAHKLAVERVKEKKE